MTGDPLITVNILSFNRKDCLKITLEKVFEQNYRNIEVIVVDNASSDGTVEMIEKEYLDVRLIKLQKNIGIAGWNEGFKIAKGEYVLVLDDDAFPEMNSISKAVKLFEENNNTGVIAYNVYNVTTDGQKIRFPGGWLPNDDVSNYSWKFFIGCAFLIRRNLFFDNLFSPAYFICFHEIPIIRYITSQNFNIIYDSEVKAFHINQNPFRLSAKKEFYHYRNVMNFLLWNVELPFNLFYSLRLLIFYFSRSIKNKWFKDYLFSLKSHKNNLQGYTLPKMNRIEIISLMKAGFIEYKLSDKILKYF